MCTVCSGVGVLWWRCAHFTDPMHIHADKDQVLYREQLEMDLVLAKVALQDKVIENVPSCNTGQLDTEVWVCTPLFVCVYSIGMLKTC